MDRVNLHTAQKYPELAELKRCKGQGVKFGFSALLLVGAGSLLVLQSHTANRAFTSLNLHGKYRPLIAAGISLLSCYVATAFTTRRCVQSLYYKTSRDD